MPETPEAAPALAVAPCWQLAGAGLLSGGLLALAFPPLNLWPLAFLIALPLVWAGCRAGKSVRRAALMVWLGALPVWFLEYWWMLNVTVVGYPLLCFYLAAYPALFVSLVAKARSWGKGLALPLSVVVPVFWVALEVLRGELVLTGFAWYLVGHPLIAVPVLAAPAGLAGQYLVSFLVTGVTGAITDALGWSGVRRARVTAGVAVAVIALLWGLTAWVGAGRDPGPDAPSIRVAVVQTAVPQDNKLDWTLDQRIADWREFAALTREAAAGEPPPDLIVWPETMFPGQWLNVEAERVERAWVAEQPGRPPTEAVAFLELLTGLVRETGVPMLIGATAIDDMRIVRAGGESHREWGARYNSVFLVDSSGVHTERYDKIDLTPFGEVIPYIWRWKWLQNLVMDVGARGMRFDLSFGSRETVFEVPVRSAGENDGRRAAGVVTPICFEATRSTLCRRLASEGGRNRASLIINLSNDGWFGGSRAGRQSHLLTSRWRCVELALPMLRAVNTGISASIDARGRIRKAGPDNPASPGHADEAAGVMVVDVPLPDRDRATPYGRFGNVFGWTVLGAAAAGLAVLLVRGRRAGRASDAAALG